MKHDIIKEGEPTSWISLLAVFCVCVKQESDALGWPLHIQPFGASMAAVQAYLSARLTARAGVITGSALGKNKAVIQNEVQPTSCYPLQSR